MKTQFRKIFIIAALFAACWTAHAQKPGVKMVPSGRNAERIISAEKLRQQIEFLTDSTFGGRATGSKGATEAALWIARRFDGAGLVPLGSGWGHSFLAGEAVGHNIIGFLPGKRESSKEMYTIVTAHYDSHGKIGDTIYPGADSNASGVVAMVSIADMFKKMKDLGRSYGRNVIFVGLDAREKNSAGAQALWDEISGGRLKDPSSGEAITPDKIHSTVVLDILGGTSAPLNKGRKDYLIMLSGGQYTFDFTRANEGPGLGLDISCSYYGSKGFTEMFHEKLGDQKVFVEKGLVCAVFTSGITMLTNKTGDTADTLDYEILKKRIFLIFHWLEKIL